MKLKKIVATAAFGGAGAAAASGVGAGIAQAVAAGKPEAVADKIAEGKLKDFYATNCLIEQAFVKDPKVTVGQLIQEKVAVIKENILVRRFTRFRVGDATPGSPTE